LRRRSRDPARAGAAALRPLLAAGEPCRAGCAEIHEPAGGRRGGSARYSRGLLKRGFYSSRMRARAFAAAGRSRSWRGDPRGIGAFL